MDHKVNQYVGKNKPQTRNPNESKREPTLMCINTDLALAGGKILDVKIKW